jgi:hypothetical protein
MRSNFSGRCIGKSFGLAPCRIFPILRTSEKIILKKFGRPAIASRAAFSELFSYFGTQDGILHVYGFGYTPCQTHFLSQVAAIFSQLGVGYPCCLRAIQALLASAHDETSVQVTCADAGTAVNIAATKAALTRNFFICAAHDSPV